SPATWCRRWPSPSPVQRLGPPGRAVLRLALPPMRAWQSETKKQQQRPCGHSSRPLDARPTSRSREKGAPAALERQIGPRFATLAALTHRSWLLLLALAGCKPVTAATEDASAVRDAAVDGAALYASLCAACHGADGTGYKADNAPSLVN